MGDRPDALRITAAFRSRRRRATSAAPVEDEAAAHAEQAPAVAHVVGDDGTLEDVPGLVGALERAGHTIGFSDRTPGAVVPEELSRAGYLILRDSAALLIKRAPCPQRVQLRVRVDGDELVLSMQSTARDGDTPDFVLGSHDLRPLHARITAAGGRMVVKTTSAGNWLTIARLPF
jgi:signal transduction histidine kinase